MSNARFVHRDSLRPKLIALSVAACFGVSASQSSANPTGGTVSSGSASFSTSGSTLTITNTAGAIINWQSFSIGVNEITRFLQSSGSSAVLNRVVGRNGVVPQSVIDGVLSSNGKVFLLNSSGILIGAGARIDVAGFVASSLNLSDQDFLAGKMRFTETPSAGKVSNAGSIDTSSAGPGGRVFLIGPDVENSGIIRTPQGQIVLAAGKSVELVSESTPFVTVSLTADSEQALNVGQLLADSGRIGMFGALVRQGGVAQANSAVVGANGEIRLVATKDLTLDAGSVTSANGPSGGNVTLQAQGGTNLISGTVEAKGSAGQGGTIQALGVRVGVLGNGVIDASGDTGGGTVLVGGDAHGANPNVQNADRTFIGSDGIIRADAGTTGDGGRVVVWANGDTRFYGSISAQGGAQSGNGGSVETSGELGLDIAGGRVNASARNGQLGTWLLDPTNVSIISGVAGAPGTDPAISGAAPGVDVFSSTPVNGGIVTNGTLQAAFAGSPANMHVQAYNNIGFYSDLTLSYSGGLKTFEVRAGNNIDLAADGTAHTITTNGQNVALSANDTTLGTVPQLNTTGTGAILGNGNITTNGGSVALSGYGIAIGTVNTSPVNPNPLQLTGGYVSMLSSAGNINTGPITTSGVTVPVSSPSGSPGGYVALTTTSGNIQVNGTIDAHGADGANLRSSNQGSAGGNVILVRSSQTSAGTITVTGDIVTYGGAGVTGTAAATGIGTGGNAGTLFIYGGINPNSGALQTALANIAINGNVNARGGSGAAGFQANAGGSGGAGGTVFLMADVGHSVTVGSPAGSIDVSGGGGGAGFTAYSVYAGGFGALGGSGGIVGVYAGTITINGGITGYGGAGGAGGDGISASLYGGTGGAGGNGGVVTLGNTTLPASTITVTSAIAADGGKAGNGGAYGGNGGDNQGSQGGFAGTISAYATGAVNLGALSANGGAGGAGSGGTVLAYASSIDFGQGGSGQNNNSGGISIGGANITTGAVSARGGAGGAGASNLNAFVYGVVVAGSSVTGSATVGSGSFGGSGGSVVLNGTGTITTGAIDASGGAGGNAGSGNTVQVLTAGGANVLPASASLTLDSGGSGGGGGGVTITGASNISITSIAASGGAAGAGGSGGSGTATTTSSANQVQSNVIAGFGGSANRGGTVNVTSTGYGTISIGSIAALGGPAGAAGNDSAFAYATSTAGGIYGAIAQVNIGSSATATGGGSVSVTNTYGNISIPGGIDVSGGAAGTANGGGTAVANSSTAAGTTAYSTASVSMGDGAEGGSGGQITLGGINITTGTISLFGQRGADGVGAVSAAATALGPVTSSAVNFGTGGNGGANSANTLNITSTGAVTLGAINANRGSGGNGANASGANGYGGSAGSGGSSNVPVTSIDITGASISIGGAISARGGDGGNGGATTAAGGFAGSGGSGGYGGAVILTATSSTTVSGTIDVSGGRGGNGGAAPAGYGGAGGSGGYGGAIALDPDTLSVGALTAAGGAGGAGGYGGIQGGAGGAGGYGGLADVFGLASGGTTVYGTIAIGSIDVSGAAGGAGGGSGGTNVYGGAGGLGGYGGFVEILGGSINMATAGTVSAIGGAGGAGGSGVGAYGGNGGNGGYGGTIDVLALSSSGYGGGSILVPVTLAVLVSGGAGGTGGATGGLGGFTGIDGLAVINGVVVSGASASGNLILEGNTVIQGTNQLVLANNAPSADDLLKKNEENKKKNQAAACK